MTDTVFIGTGKCKKAYSVKITERIVNEKGKVTTISKNNTSFQIKDIFGESDLLALKKRLMEALK